MASYTQRMIDAAKLDVKAHAEVEHDQHAPGRLVPVGFRVLVGVLLARMAIGQAR